jgi:hypothetical protein
MFARFFLNHRRIGNAVVQRLLPVVEQDPKETCAARSEAQEITNSTETGLAYVHPLPCIDIHYSHECETTQPVAADLVGNRCSGTHRVTAVSVNGKTHPEVDAHCLRSDLSSRRCE